MAEEPALVRIRKSTPVEADLLYLADVVEEAPRNDDVRIGSRERRRTERNLRDGDRVFEEAADGDVMNP